jgi:hypothetical protein
MFHSPLSLGVSLGQQALRFEDRDAAAASLRESVSAHRSQRPHHDLLGGAHRTGQTVLRDDRDQLRARTARSR